MVGRYIGNVLVKELERKISYLRELDSHDVLTSCQKRRRKSIEKNAKVNSFRIENPGTQVPFCVPRNKNRHGIREGIENITNASRWAITNFDPDNFDESFFRGIAIRIFPDIYVGDFAEYRTTGTSISGATVTPPDPYKLRAIEIPWLVDSLRSQFRLDGGVHRVETAIFSHLHMARIHPFVDGNGRTARVLQDTILDYSRIPVPVVESGERMTYYDLLDRAVYDWKHNGGKEYGVVTNGEERFFNYIAGKINVSLDNVLEKCACPNHH